METNPDQLPPLSPGLETLRRRYSDLALASIPKLLLLADRNRYSPTYGSFDRAYWHYRTMDFPCGMAQEFVLPLALVYRYPFADNPYFQRERMKEFALAGIDFARKSSHKDGSCDDYFPFERALGAAVFSLHACTESSLVLGEKRTEHLEFFVRRGEWLLKHNESGRLTNHQALAALGLHNVFLLTGEDKFARGRDRYLDIVKSWQSEEGWFQEYEGADPGYHSCTISYLAKLLRKLTVTSVNSAPNSSLSERLLAMLRPAVQFAWYFMHPDGGYAGEYGSRNTYHFFPHGFEVMAPHEPKAAQIADQFLKVAVAKGTRYFNDDDRMCAHYVYDWLQACLDFSPQRADPLNDRPNFTRYFPKAKMLVKKTNRYYAVAGLAKGGVVKITDPQGTIYSDTGLIGKLRDGRTVVTHLVDDYQVKVEERTALESVEATVGGFFCERRVKLASPFKQILFRCLNLTLGRFASDFLRRVLQKILITGKPRTPYRFTRRLVFSDDQVQIEDEIIKPPETSEFVSLHAGSDATSIYVANSNVYQSSVLLPWRDLTDRVPELNAAGRIAQKHSAIPK